MDAERILRGADGRAVRQLAGLRVHMIGIGGSGMRAIAAMLMDHGAVVTGSDAADSGAVQRLARAGAEIHIGQQASNIPDQCDLVVCSAAIHEHNPELSGAAQRGIEVIKYSQMLGRLMAEKVGIAVAGTHGKSTTTAMVAYALRQAGVEPSYIIGATVDQLDGPSGVGRGRHFVAEACEFDRSFLNLTPTLATVLNIEEDHLDCFHDIGDIIEAFRAFAGRVRPDGLLVVNGEDRNCVSVAGSAQCEVQTFGMAEHCNWRGWTRRTDRGRVTMDVTFNGDRFCRIRTPLAGLHNAYNALAAMAVLYHTGIDYRQMPRRLECFRGARRRMTLKAIAGGVTVVDDFAHHPTEIQATLRALREAYQPQRLICVFQPHQHSRTRFLLKDFARSFGSADEVILPDIYFVRDSDREKDYVSAGDLAAQIRLNGGSALYLSTFDEILRHLWAELAAGDLLVTMGAGDIWKVADETVQWLGTNRQA